MGAKGGEFIVKIRKREVVAAMSPMQHSWVQQSNLDLLIPKLLVSVFFCYKKPNSSALTFESMVRVLKSSMAQALTSYYTFGGELVINSVGEPELLCNNRGVDFEEAFTDIELRDINFYKPDESINGKLIPTLKHGVLAIQVTELKCGAMVVGCTFDHRVADAYSANMFLISWAELAQSNPISTIPSFDRSLLTPRHPISIDPSLDHTYGPISSSAAPSKPPPPVHDADYHTSRLYFISADQLNSLQSLANDGGKKVTKFVAFSAFLWKLIAKFESGNEMMAKLGIVVDGRSRLSDGSKETLMASYFGNVFSVPFGGKRVDELSEQSLSWVAGRLHEFLDPAVTRDHFLNLIDWVEVHRPEAAVTKIFKSGREEGAAVVVSSGRRFPESEVEFGWGKPVLGSYYFPWDGESGYVMPMPSPRRNGDWVVFMHMLKRQLDLIETHAGDVFRPINFDYLNQSN